MTENIKVAKNIRNIKDHRLPMGAAPLVTISCTTYNQEEYIEQCIEGFLVQETDFSVEILIHDDASTDRTPEILKRYQSLYPHLIDVILQEENQFSKGVMVNSFNFERAKGKYIALCHGDDYWIDKEKLRKQVAVMEKYDVDICGHPAKEIDVKGTDLHKLTGVKVENVSYFSAKDLIKRNGNMLPFGSIMLTANAKAMMLQYMPPVMFHSGIQLLAALRNGLVILPDEMMAYRIDVPGSTTEIMLGDSDRKLNTTMNRVNSIKALKVLYGKDNEFELIKLLCKQLRVSSLFKSKTMFFTLLKCIMKGEKAPTKFLIFILGSAYMLKIMMVFR